MFVVIFGQEGCQYCIKAKELAESYKQQRVDFNYRYVDIKVEGITKKDLTDSVGEEVTTVPQIFIDKKPIGGFVQFQGINLDTYKQ